MPAAGGLCLDAESGSDDPDAPAQDKDEDDPWRAAARAHARWEGDVDPELCFTSPLAGEGSSSGTSRQAGFLPLGDALRDRLRAMKK